MIRRSIVKIEVAEAMMPICNLVHWGLKNAFHGTVISPIPDNKEKEYYNIIF